MLEENLFDVLRVYVSHGGHLDARPERSQEEPDPGLDEILAAEIEAPYYMEMGEMARWFVDEADLDDLEGSLIQSEKEEIVKNIKEGPFYE